MDLHLRLKNLCKSRGTSIAAIEARLGLGNGTAGKWWKNGRVPNFANLSAVAAELDTTVAYLTGETDDPSAGIIKDPIREDGAVSPAAQEILDFLDSASGEELADVIKYIRYLKSQREQK